MKYTVTLLDGYALIYRTYFAFFRRPLMNRLGQNISVVYGFFNTLLNYIDQYHPSQFAVILDSRTPTFRHQIYPLYKANRDSAPEDLHAQIPLVEKLLEQLGIPVLRQDGMEADDIIASIATQCSEKEVDCRIITGDKDLLQLVDRYVHVMKPQEGEYEELDEAKVEEIWGIKPNQILDFLSLTGDKADNVPGVKGVGEKGALKLLNNYQTLEGIYEHTQELTGALQKNIIEGKENAFLSKELIRLKIDLPYKPETIPLLSLNRKAASPLFIALGIPSLAEKSVLDQPNSEALLMSEEERKLLETFAKASTKKFEKKEDEKKGAEGRKIPASPQKEYRMLNASFPPEAVKGKRQAHQTKLITTLEELKAKLAEAKKATMVAFDTETDGIDEMSAHLVGFSFCYDGECGYYFPVRMNEQNPDYLMGCYEKSEILPILKDFFATPGLNIIGQNWKFDYKVLLRYGAAPPFAYADTLIAAWLLDSDLGSYNMDFLADRLLNYTTISFKEVVPKGKNFASVELQLASEYAGEDALITYRLWKELAPRLQFDQMEKIFFEREMPLSALLTKMEMEGIYVDRVELQCYSQELAQQIEVIRKTIYDKCGEEFNLDSPKQLSTILFEKRKLPATKKTKTGYSTDTSVLQQLLNQDPVIEQIIRYRALSKLKSTYTDSLSELINPSTGRVHTRLIQTGTATGRLSSKDPNLQNIPIRDEEGRRIRRAFKAGEGKIFLSADYSQIELAVLASLSGDEALCKAFREGIDIHRQSASLIFQLPFDEVTADQRRIAKTINFGVMYGMSSFRLARELEIPSKQAAQFIDSYFTTYNGIQKFMDETIASVQSCGFVETQGGHRRRIQSINSANRVEQQSAERIAINTPIQGTAADIMKRAMLAIDKRLTAECFQAKILLQIHDELLLELPYCEKEALSLLVKEEMEKAAELTIPIKVSIETGEIWGEFH